MSISTRTITAFGLLVSWLAPLPGQNAAAPSAAGLVPVIISLKVKPGDREQEALRAAGVRLKRVYSIIDGVAADIPADAVEALKRHPLVSAVEEDLPIQAHDEYDSAWGVNKIGSRTIHNLGNRGVGVKVCVIDTGIDYNHPDLAANYIGGYDFVNNDNDPFDDNGHGTHVAGTIGAVGNGVGVIGVAPSVQLLGYKVLGSNGSGSFSAVISAVERCAADGGQVTNNSYGASGNPGSAVQAAFDNAYAAGVLHVASAGNTATCANVSYPSKFNSVIAVAATDINDNLASFSCRGDAKLEIAGPGVNVNSTSPGGGYRSLSGTSMASPHVAGTAALILGCGLQDLTSDGKVDHRDVRVRLALTALDLGTPGRDTNFGFGRVRADVAAQNCGAGPGETIPNAPSNLSITGSATRSITLGWQDNSSVELYYEVLGCLHASCTTWTRLGYAGPNAQSFTANSLPSGSVWRFIVRAANNVGFSSWSNLVVGQVP